MVRNFIVCFAVKIFNELNTSDVGKALKSCVAAEGVQGLWRGLGPTLFRDVPFSGVYWAIYESLKAHNGVTVPTFSFSFAGGAIAGSVSFPSLRKVCSKFIVFFELDFRLPHS